MATLPVEDNEIGRLKWVSGIGNSSGRLFISSMEIYIFSYTEYKLIQNHYSVKYLKFCREYTIYWYQKIKFCAWPCNASKNLMNTRLNIYLVTYSKTHLERIHSDKAKSQV